MDVIKHQQLNMRLQTTLYCLGFCLGAILGWGGITPRDVPLPHEVPWSHVPWLILAGLLCYLFFFAGVGLIIVVLPKLTLFPTWILTFVSAGMNYGACFYAGVFLHHLAVFGALRSSSDLLSALAAAGGTVFLHQSSRLFRRLPQLCRDEIRTCPHQQADP